MGFYSDFCFAYGMHSSYGMIKKLRTDPYLNEGRLFPLSSAFGRRQKRRTKERGQVAFGNYKAAHSGTHSSAYRHFLNPSKNPKLSGFRIESRFAALSNDFPIRIFFTGASIFLPLMV